ncbi:MAG: hypothetical protein FWE33_04280 [Defluviitaleaceae bacterium]|nr:hypothetical protein [Defluviitaleaceae bacterium]
MNKLFRLTAVALAMVMVFMTMPVGVFAQSINEAEKNFTPTTITIEEAENEIQPRVINYVAILLGMATAGAYNAGLAIGEDLAHNGQDLNGAQALAWRAAALTVFSPIGSISFNLGLSNGWHRVMG